MSRTMKGTLAVILSAVLFGLMPVAAKFIYANGSNSMTLTWHRFLFSVPFIWIVMRTRGETVPRVPGALLPTLLLAALGNVSTPVLSYLSYNYIPTGLVTTLHFVYPVLVLLGGAIFFKQRVDLVRGICCALCLAGITAFYTPGGSVSTFGILLALGSGLTFAFYVLLIAHSGLKKYSALQLSLYIGLIGSVGLLAVNLLLGTLRLDLTPAGWLGSILFSIGSSGLATVLFQYGVKEIGAQNTSLLSTFEPLTSVIVGILFMSEQLTAQTGAGIGLILLAVVILGLADRRKSGTVQAKNVLS